MPPSVSSVPAGDSSFTIARKCFAHRISATELSTRGHWPDLTRLAPREGQTRDDTCFGVAASRNDAGDFRNRFLSRSRPCSLPSARSLLVKFRLCRVSATAPARKGDHEVNNSVELSGA